DSFQANAPFVAPSTWALSNVYLYQEQDEVAFNPNVRFKLDAGPARTTLLVGGDYTRLTDTGILTSDLLTGGAGLVDLADPTFPTPFLVPPDSPFTTFQKPGNEYVTQGLYAQLQTTLQERIHLLAGLRLANIKIDYIDPVAFADFQTDTTKLLPRAGAVVDVLPGLSVFASYSQGLKANPYTFFVGEPEPEESEQRETGVKLNLGGSLTGTLAVFEIDRSKVPVPVSGGFASAAIGEQRSRGFEADLLYQLGANWQVLANYAYVDAELVEAASGASAGSKLVGVPEHSGRVWLNYGFDADVLPGWSVGAGVYAAAGSPVDLANRYVTEDYFTIDAKVAYDADTFSAAVHVKNLTGEEYFVPYSYFNGRVAPGEERAVYGTVKVRY
ncbi:MAG: TonB-dependent receptor, partial [Hyphomicrobiaceae bacterium]|nr:TonB-dependent receptor [Hyphomicrobiaceae bacterium]